MEKIKSRNHTHIYIKKNRIHKRGKGTQTIKQNTSLSFLRRKKKICLFPFSFFEWKEQASAASPSTLKQPRQQNNNSNSKTVRVVSVSCKCIHDHIELTNGMIAVTVMAGFDRKGASGAPYRTVFPC